MDLRKEMRAYTRSCEELLCLNGKLTEDERSLLEYYVNELSREFLSHTATVQLGYATQTVERSSEA
jgi:hypothetical protein